MTVTVHLPEPQSAAGYLAYYADGETGAPEPWGAGYGGNDSGISDNEGRWSSTWIVSPDAPTGPARVDIYVAVHDVGKGFKALPFEVSDIAGC